MKVITKKPIVYKGEVFEGTETLSPLGGVYSNLDGKSSSAEILAFQKFANTRSAGLKEDGKWGPNTSAAWATFGPLFTNASSTTTATSPVTTPSAEKTRAEKVKEGIGFAKESGILDTITGLFGKKSTAPAEQSLPGVAPSSTPQPATNNTMKYVLIGGGVLVLGLVIYFATKSNSSGGK